MGMEPTLLLLLLLLERVWKGPESHSTVTPPLPKG